MLVVNGNPFIGSGVPPKQGVKGDSFVAGFRNRKKYKIYFVKIGGSAPGPASPRF